MTEIAIDIGNSSTKWAIFADHEILKSGRDSKKAEDVLEELIAFYPESSIVASSVVQIDFESDKLLRVTHQTSLPIRIDYKTPTTLGMDRIVAAVGAQALFPVQNCLIVDLGTCITLDFLSEDGVFQGGAISPGLNMRFKALNKGTDLLPLLQLNESEIGLPGKTTSASIQNGVFYGILDEISGTIQRYENQFGKLKVVLTGGDMNVFESRLKNDIFADAELVLKGLHEISRFNQTKV